MPVEIHDCKRCGNKMRYTPKADKLVVSTISGLKEWSFNGFFSCTSGKCRHIIQDKEVKAGCNADSHDDGIPPTNKLVGILPTIL